MIAPGERALVAVSGGKDSYWQAHLVKEVYGLRPLLVTYHGNNYLPEGQGNLDRMREAVTGQFSGLSVP